MPADLAHRVGSRLGADWVLVAGLAVATVSLPVAAAVTTARARDRVLVVAVTCLLTGGLCAASRSIAVHSGPVRDLAAQEATVEVTGVVLTDPQRRSASGGRSSTAYTVLRIRLEEITARGQRMRVRTPVVAVAGEQWLGLLPGQRVRVGGRLSPAERGGPVAAMLRTRGEPETLGSATAAYRVAEPLRRGLQQAMADRPPGPGGLIPALVVGDESRLTEELRADLRASGLTHLTAVSGANVAIVVSAVLGVARWGGVRAYGLPAVGLLAVAGFVVLARPQPSVLRAAAMGTVAVAGLAAGSRSRGVPALGAAVLCLLLADPWLGRDPGFALSVLATAGILLFGPPWRDAVGRWLPRPLAEGLVVPLAAQAATVPVLVALTDSVSVVGLPANILAAPAVAPATILGAIIAVISPVFPAGAELLARIAVLPAGWIVTVAGHSAGLPGATASWPSGWTGVGLAVGVVCVLVAIMPGVLARPRNVALAALVLGFAVWRPVHPGWPPQGWVLVACDVGQGDALVVRTADDSAVLIDAGPDPREVDRCLRDLGIVLLPAVVLTHFHADHVEGLPGVLHDREVGEVIVSPLDDPPEQARRVHRWASQARVPVVVGQAGDRRVAGEATWEVLWPRRLITGEGSPANNASLVLLVEVVGLRVLLSGDVEPPAQRALRAALPDGPVDVLKVPHHGSAYQDPSFLAATRPSVAVVSVGEDNSYGHPDPATLDLLERSGSMVLRTDVDGTVAIVQSDGRLGIVRRG